MKNLSELVKGNPVVVGSIVVALLALVALFLFVRPSGTDFIAEMEKRKADEGKITQLMKTPWSVPGKKAEEPPTPITLTVNPAALEAISEVYKNMTTQYKSVFDKATAINHANHTPMIDGLFPESTQNSKQFVARSEYKAALQAMLGKPVSADKDAPRLNAGSPFPAERLEEELAKVTNKFLAGFFPRKTESELSETDRKRLNAQRQELAMKLVTDHAKRISIYAVEDEDSEEYPFHRGAWIKESNLPDMRDVWEGQMALWIQQDLVRAIAMANRNKDTGKLESVLNAPVKQLVGIRVFEGYVGINSTGSVGRLNEGREKNQTGGAAMELLQRADATKILDDVKNYNPDKPLPEAFNVSLTGRVGNAIYDVRHVQLSVIADYRQLPALFEAIGKVNFMTIINTHVSDVDEFPLLEAGYVFGQHDCVQVEMVIETIWLRQWTSALMPKAIKDELGIVEKPAEAAPGAPGTPASPGTPGAPAAPAKSNAP
jgi:hypothetical protein